MRAPVRVRNQIALAAVGVFALAGSGTHVVESGETLSDIAVEHGTTVRALVEANGISNPNLIVQGTELVIPDGRTSSASGGGARETTYVVERGDTLDAIARKFGTTARSIATVNEISNPNLVVIGRSLRIVTDAASAPSAGTSGGQVSSGRQLAGQRHLVKPGDTVAGIARRYGISAQDFVRWNGLQDGSLYATTRLLLFDPGTLPGAASAKPSAPTTYEVKRGDTLSGVANRHGTSISAIAEASGLSNVNAIFIGQTLTIPSTNAGGGGLRCPVPGARFINGWGFARSGGRAHAGIDLFAARGTPVVAPASGWVDVATGTVGGHQFRLTDANGTLWFGSHMDSFGERGQVSAGDVIGYVGDSGNARGSNPHLHFEVHPEGRAINPHPFLRSVC